MKTKHKLTEQGVIATTEPTQTQKNRHPKNGCGRTEQKRLESRAAARTQNRMDDGPAPCAPVIQEKPGYKLTQKKRRFIRRKLQEMRSIMDELGKIVTWLEVLVEAGPCPTCMDGEGRKDCKTCGGRGFVLKDSANKAVKM